MWITFKAPFQNIDPGVSKLSCGWFHFSDMFIHFHTFSGYCETPLCLWSSKISKISGSWLTSQPGLIWDGAISSFGSLAGPGVGIIPGGHTEVPSSRVATDTKKQSMSLAELGHVGSFRIHQLWVVHLKSLLPFSSPMMYNDVYWCLLYTVLKWSTHVYPLYPSVYSNMRWEIQKK